MHAIHDIGSPQVNDEVTLAGSGEVGNTRKRDIISYWADS